MADPLEQFKNRPAQVPGQNTEAGNAVPSLEAVAEKDMFSYLSGKAGFEVKSWDDFKPKTIEKEIVKDAPVSYASEEVAAADRYVRETGRGFSDYMKVLRNWSQEPDERIAMDYMRVENPDLDEEEIRDLYAHTFGLKPADGEEMDDATFQSVQDQNRMRELSMKTYAGRGRRYFESEQEKYKVPAGEKADTVKAGGELWKENMGKAIREFKSLESGEFRYDFQDSGKYAHFADLQKMMDGFKEDGVMNYGRLARTLVTGEELENILAEHTRFVEANTREAVMKEYSNHQGVLARTLSGNVGEDARKEHNARMLTGINQRKY